MQTHTPDMAVSTFDLAGEANHRIANHLAMLVGIFRKHAQRLKQQQEAVPAAEVGMLLDGFGSKVEAMARLHAQLIAPGGPQTIQLGDYLNELSASLTEALPTNGRIGLDLELDAGCAVSTARALPIGLIVCELVTNATKHAHPTGVAGRISLRCRRLGNDLVVEVEDDGVGFPEGLNPDSEDSVGLRTIRELAAAIDGTIRYRSHGLGLIAELRVPANGSPED